ncbi:hypothetical protein V6N11_042335 [Hibiscus sabdariffa]|uniref:Uncharacterized protein n=1 Tax=Hibiscus sabdariffa TaxID=183260 RepID=A0ABR2QW95_9ROSI
MGCFGDVGTILFHCFAICKVLTSFLDKTLEASCHVHPAATGYGYRNHPNQLLSKPYMNMAQNVKVLGASEASDLSGIFYNDLYVFVNPTLRPRGLDLTLILAMHYKKPVLTPCLS